MGREPQLIGLTRGESRESSVSLRARPGYHHEFGGGTADHEKDTRLIGRVQPLAIESFVWLLNYDHTIRPGKCLQYGDFGVRKGQMAMKQEMDAAEQVLSAIADKFQEAQSLDVTQNVMKSLTDMVSYLFFTFYTDTASS